MGFLMASPIKNKNGVWTTRLVVPKDLRPIVGKSELKRSLGTKEEREARLSHPTVLAEFQAEIERARRKAESDLRLTDSVIDAIIFEWKQATAKHFYGIHGAINPFVMKSGGFIEENNLPVIDVLDEIENFKLRERANEIKGVTVDPERKAKRLRKLYSQLEQLVGEFFYSSLVGYGVEPDLDSQQYRKLLAKFALAYVDMTRSAVKKQVSDIDLASHGVHLESIDKLQPVDMVDTSFEEVWEEYKQSTIRRESTKGETRIRDYSSAIERFLKMYPNKMISSFTKRDLATFRNMLESLPTQVKKDIKALSLEEQVAKAQELGLKLISQAGVRKQMNAISAVFTYAVRQDYIQNNPVHGVVSDIKKTGGDPTGKDYTPEEIRSIFGSKLFHDDYRPSKADYGEAPYWLPIMLYYTGARAEELAQLYIDDISLDSDIPFIQISEDREDQSVKTGERRQVPIHQHLLELGFAEYVNSLSQEGRLFPKLNKSKNTKYHSKVSLWFGKYIADELGISRANLKPFHAFRHTFITICRVKNVRIDVQKSITGHSQGDVASQYGSYGLDLKNEVVQQIPKCF